MKFEENEIHLIHQSATDYLLRQTPDPNPELEAFRVDQREADLHIARRCFFYLQEGGLEKIYTTSLVPPRDALRYQCDAFPLLEYAIQV